MLEKGAAVDDIAEPNEDGLVSSPTDSIISKTTKPAQSVESENQTKTSIDSALQSTTTKTSTTESSVPINFTPLVLIMRLFPCLSE